MSADGTRYAVGAPYHGRNGPAISESLPGLVRVFEWDGSNWNQLGADFDGQESEVLGWSVSLSSDGNRLAFGLPGGGTDGTGEVQVYEWNGASWDQLGPGIEGEVAADFSGFSVSMSSDGNIIAVSSISNDGANPNSNSGHVRLYQWSDVTSSWDQLGSDIDGQVDQAQFGFSISLSSDGTTVAVGAPQHDGINGDDSGHVTVFSLTCAPPSQEPSSQPTPFVVPQDVRLTD